MRVHDVFHASLLKPYVRGANVQPPPMLCHAQSLAETNRVTDQLNWLTVKSFFISCSISWMASLINNLYLLDLIVLVIN